MSPPTEQFAMEIGDAPAMRRQLSVRSTRNILLEVVCVLAFVCSVYYYMLGNSYGRKKEKCDLNITSTNHVYPEDDGDANTATSSIHCVSKCPGKSNAYNCGVHYSDRFSVIVPEVDHRVKHYAKTPPPLTTTEDGAVDVVAFVSRVLRVTNWSSLLSDSMTLVLPKDGRDGIKMLASQSLTSCCNNRKKITAHFKYTYADPATTIEFDKRIDRIDSTAVAIFVDLSTCVVLVHFNHMFKIPANDNDIPTAGNCLHMCLRHSIGYHCVCLNADVDKTGRLGISEYLKNSSLSTVGYEPIQKIHQLNLNADIVEMIGNGTFDYNLKTRKIYYHDATSKDIRYINMNFKTIKPLTVVTNVSVPTDGLAYDWVTNNLYFIDSAARNIKVIGLNHYEPAEIVSAVENSSIEALGILPRQGLLVYMREDPASRTIYRTALDGTDSAVVAKTDRRSSSSNSFVVDAREEMVYWSDVRDNSVRQFDLDGNLRKTSSPPKLYRFVMDLNENCDLFNISADAKLVEMLFVSKEIPRPEHGAPRRDFFFFF